MKADKQEAVSSGAEAEKEVAVAAKQAAKPLSNFEVKQVARIEVR